MASVGKDVESICGKCKAETWHIIVAMDGTTIVKAQCKKCGATHRYRPPGGTVAKKKTTTTRKPRAKKPAGPEVEADPSRPARPYNVKTAFEPGDTILHKTFGEGVVQAVTGPQKIEVWFLSGELKRLVHAR